MKIACKCGKILHADECGFHNDNYGDFSIYLCPYCRSVYPSFITASLREIRSMQEARRRLEESFQRSVEERTRQLTERMIQLNDKALAKLYAPDDLLDRIVYFKESQENPEP
jgi:C4-dicarboxylate-specific signal transduction histidine kinase